MSTHCLIGYIKEDKTIDFIYCHKDGYLAHTGKYLETFYNDENKIKSLLNLGDIEFLDKNLPKDSNENIVISFNNSTDIIRNIKSINELKEYLKNHWISYSYLRLNNEWYYLKKINDNHIELIKLHDIILFDIDPYDEERLNVFKYIKFEWN